MRKKLIKRGIPLFLISSIIFLCIGQNLFSEDLSEIEKSRSYFGEWISEPLLIFHLDHIDGDDKEIIKLKLLDDMSFELYVYKVDSNGNVISDQYTDGSVKGNYDSFYDNTLNLFYQSEELKNGKWRSVLEGLVLEIHEINTDGNKIKVRIDADDADKWQNYLILKRLNS